MPTPKKPQRSRLSGRRAGGRRKTSAIDQVREGVRRFILDEASIGDFYSALRSAVGKGKLSPNPLTGTAFRKIVREVFDERKRAARTRRRR